MQPYTRDGVERAMRETPFGPLEPAAEWTDEYYDLESEGWRWQNARGMITAPVIGDCLAMLEAQLLTDTPFLPARAVRGGSSRSRFPGRRPRPRWSSAFSWRSANAPFSTPNERESYRRRQRWVITTTAEEYCDLPIVFDLDFGHPAPDLPLPLGAPMTIDPNGRTIRFTQSS